MARINNQAVLQKLIDELKLYPSKDAIPTELAEKILPVFQINSEDVNVEMSNPKRYLTETTLADYDKSFVVPSGKQWKLLNVSGYVDASNNDTHVILRIKDSAGVTIQQFEVLSGVANADPILCSFNPTASVKTETNEDGATKIINVPIPEIYMNEDWSFQIITDANLQGVGATYFKVYYMIEEMDTDIVEI